MLQGPSDTKLPLCPALKATRPRFSGTIHEHRKSTYTISSILKIISRYIHCNFVLEKKTTRDFLSVAILVCWEGSSDPILQATKIAEEPHQRSADRHWFLDECAYCPGFGSLGWNFVMGFLGRGKKLLVDSLKLAAFYGSMTSHIIFDFVRILGIHFL